MRRRALPRPRSSRSPGRVASERPASHWKSGRTSSMPTPVASGTSSSAALNDGALIGDTIVSALQLKQGTRTARSRHCSSALADRRVLLILDNCEHLLDPVVEVADQLLRRCPDLRIVATSREALGMAGESLMPVPSMSLPEPGGPGSPEAFERVAACDAVQLFIDRGRAVLPGFALTEENAEAIGQICLRLDGIPLAVELAAARVRSLPPHQIAARLDNRFRLLTGGSRTSLPRHRTLRAAMDWSFDMLGEPEQALLPRLSAFAGSFSLEAAEAVATGGAVDRDEVIDLLARLVDKSLLMPGGRVDRGQVSHARNHSRLCAGTPGRGRRSVRDLRAPSRLVRGAGRAGTAGILRGSRACRVAGSPLRGPRQPACGAAVERRGSGRCERGAEPGVRPLAVLGDPRLPRGGKRLAGTGARPDGRRGLPAACGRAHRRGRAGHASAATTPPRRPRTRPASCFTASSAARSQSRPHATTSRVQPSSRATSSAPGSSIARHSS